LKKKYYLCSRFDKAYNMKEKTLRIISLCLIILGIGGLIGINIYLKIEYDREYEKTKVAVEQVVDLLEQAVKDSQNQQEHGN